MDSHVFQVAPYGVKHLPQAYGAYPPDRALLPHVPEPAVFLGYDLHCEVCDVCADVAAGRHLRLDSQFLEVAGVEGSVEQGHLCAGVVDVVFLLDRVAGGLEDAGQRAPEHRPTPVPHVQGPGGVNADVLHLHPRPSACVDAAVGRPGLHYGVDLRLEPFVFQPKVDESRPSQGYALYLLGGGEIVEKALGDGQGAHARASGQLQGSGDRVVSVLRFLGPLHHGFGQGDLGQYAPVLGLLGGLSDH